MDAVNHRLGKISVDFDNYGHADSDDDDDRRWIRDRLFHVTSDVTSVLESAPGYAMATTSFHRPFRRRSSFSMDSEKDIQSSDLHALHNTGQVWQKVSPGLNLVGICENQQCKASGKKILMRQGFGTFNINKFACISKCPSCETTAKKIDNCGFLKCVYSVEGTYLDSEKKKVTVKQENLIAPDDKFLLFESTELNEWLFMDITVRKKTKEDRAKEKKLSKSKCLVM